MSLILKKRKAGTIYYYQKGASPVLLLLSGTHGDEFGVINPLKQVINKYLSKLPDFIFIPEVSPSAVKKRTRRNGFKNDVNRNFFEKTKDIEAKANMEIVARYKFKLGLTFHEDPQLDSFYLYDSEIMSSKLLHTFKAHIKEQNIGLYSGIDDANDVSLGNVLDDGYITVPAHAKKIIHGDFWDWSLLNGYVKRLLCPEIPGKLGLKNKTFLVDLIFKDLIFPLLNI
ncbi:hypothetical protein A3C98_00335 [Candidatus Roizmanbacteria bacterium RIFCSPHIGHO2_02_FULL_37_15]|uniref:Succinylglutamate desuccinylase n=1 Tax=Candidatus Roizmanbacteria bacterium RIFCSPLOWO2_01_FULL_37_16 TaxID=1802058 RepID=A0A1F7IQD6_9BACT|nr:MAG: hypothetical protein A2859_00580 [Candidatus Roizmanbacteria bacterium RIFCSPHIGHO2_01_FULL_37_16b]OGK20349.1 MAG: hypothetical protein A3C98_00335 [Candidatus Roizmanbacteria bacterium RIFCSPHIGHO2_02_FULL_37_15]OGK31713.1 MAG: hypothetical protein A3F57_03935 [Candidatus Roizmanbacteria bacterium RIFCSPHIGHO2_12_FULL_36_11]OGK45565.1 MAG: hypothetical protein A3B40_01180 [Candidatus Roizmanbacteria bacterium RIFCSPLOWO2_01_FULL_37_16]OGK56274.1 MAG: hypothetical protein A3I50_03560 [C